MSAQEAKAHGPVPNGLPVLRLTSRPESLREWFGGLWRFRHVLVALARKDFRVRYKRASLGVLWAVLMPVLQAAVMAFIFSRITRFGGHFSYGVYVLAGTVAWFYASTSFMSSTTAIIEASNLTDKVWFPRAILTLVPPAANLIMLLISILTLLIALPVLGVPFTLKLLLLIPGIMLLIGFTAALGLVLGALDVYFRDVKFIVQAAIIVWFYVTPIIYPVSALHAAGKWLFLNPLTGIVGLFQRATVGLPVPSTNALIVSVASTLGLGAIAVMTHRRHDRLFVDQL